MPKNVIKSFYFISFSQASLLNLMLYMMMRSMHYIYSVLKIYSESPRGPNKNLASGLNCYYFEHTIYI